MAKDLRICPECGGRMVKLIVRKDKKYNAVCGDRHKWDFFFDSADMTREGGENANRQDDGRG